MLLILYVPSNLKYYNIIARISHCSWQRYVTAFTIIAIKNEISYKLINDIFSMLQAIVRKFNSLNFLMQSLAPWAYPIVPGLDKKFFWSSIHLAYCTSHHLTFTQLLLTFRAHLLFLLTSPALLQLYGPSVQSLNSQKILHFLCNSRYTPCYNYHFSFFYTFLECKLMRIETPTVLSTAPFPILSSWNMEETQQIHTT